MQKIFFTFISIIYLLLFANISLAKDFSIPLNDQTLINIPDIKSFARIADYWSKYRDTSLYLIPTESNILIIYLPNGEINQSNKKFPTRYILISLLKSENNQMTKDRWQKTHKDLLNTYKNKLGDRKAVGTNQLYIIERIPISESFDQDTSVNFIEFIKYYDPNQQNIVLNKIIKTSCVFIKNSFFYLTVASEYKDVNDLHWVNTTSESFLNEFYALNKPKEKVIKRGIFKGLPLWYKYASGIIIILLYLGYFVFDQYKKKNSKIPVAVAASTSPQKSIWAILFSWQGTISAKEYIKGGFVLIYAAPFLGVIALLISFGTIRYIGVYALLIGPTIILYISIFLVVKRLRAIGLSTWYALLGFLPIAQLVLLFYLLFTPDKNIPASSIEKSITTVKQISPEQAIQAKSKIHLAIFAIGITIFVFLEPMVFLTLKFFFMIFIDPKNILGALFAIPLGFFALLMYFAAYFLKIIAICLVLILPGFIVWLTAYILKNYEEGEKRLIKVIYLYIPIYMVFIILKGSIIFNLGNGNPFDMGVYFAGKKEATPLTLFSRYK